MFEHSGPVAVGDREVELLVRAERRQRHVVHGPGHARAVHDRRSSAAAISRWAPRTNVSVDGRRVRPSGPRAERCAVADVSIDCERVVRCSSRLRKGGGAGGEECDGRSREGPSEEAHIPKNVPDHADRCDPADATRGRRRLRRLGAPLRPALPPLQSCRRSRRPTPTSCGAVLSGEPGAAPSYAGLARRPGGRHADRARHRSGDRAAASSASCSTRPTSARASAGASCGPSWRFLPTKGSAGFIWRWRGTTLGRSPLTGPAGLPSATNTGPIRNLGIDVEALLEGPAAGVVSPYVRLGPDGRYRVRVVRMERRLTPVMKDDPPT